jgi:UDP-glucose 4-epimerase
VKFIKNQKILITGANGYIGSHLAKSLIDLNYSVVLTDVQESSILGYKYYYKEDLVNPSRLSELLEDVKYIFFFTGKTGPADESFCSPNNFIIGNEVTLTNLLSKLKDLKVKPKIIFPSTRLLYQGLVGQPLNENSTLEAKTVYAVNKIACENYLDLYHRCFEIEYVIFRISLPYGSFIPQKKVSYGVMSYLINRAKSGNSLKIYGNGDQIGTFIHIKDLIKVIISGAFSNNVSNDIFNIGGHDNLKMKDAILAIAEKFNVAVDHVDWPVISQFAENGDLIFNSNKLSSKLHCSYDYSFKKWLELMK